MRHAGKSTFFSASPQPFSWRLSASTPPRAAAVEDTIAHGFFLIDRNGDGRMDYFSHNGANWGYRSIFYAHMQAGYGAVVLMNSDNGNGACSLIVENIGKKHEWEGF